MELLKGWKNPDSPRGPIMIDPETRDIVQNDYIRRVEKVNGQAGQRRVRDDPDGQGPVEGDSTAEVRMGQPRSPRSRIKSGADSPAWGGAAHRGAMDALISILFHGLAYAMVLYIDLGRAVGDHGPDGLRQPGARRVRDGRRLRHRDADERLRRAVRPGAARRRSSSWR